jgi:hypothetical protein
MAHEQCTMRVTFHDERIPLVNVRTARTVLSMPRRGVDESQDRSTYLSDTIQWQLIESIIFQNGSQNF